MSKYSKELGTREFVSLMAFLMATNALSIDAMLPALGQMSKDLYVTNINDIQMVITSLFLGMSFGVIIYGPLSDAFGRKKIVYLGLSIFLIGVLISIFATNLNEMLIGRMIQGFGAASCRVVTTAIIRDKFKGNEMGKIMSMIMIMFILVPALAPSIGQFILLFAGWQYIFWFMFCFAIIGMLWLHFRLKEPLPIEKRIKFSMVNIYSGMREALSHPVSRGYMVSLGLLFGAFVSYLSSAQQIFDTQYNIREMFALYFGAMALVLGFSSFLNSRLINIFGMEKLCLYALMLMTSCSLFFLIYENSFGLNLFEFLCFLSLIFLCSGILFGNLNALALTPFGHIAGVATSIISSVQTFLAVIVGIIIGQFFDGTPQPMIAAFFICGAINLIIVTRIQRHGPQILE